MTLSIPNQMIRCQVESEEFISESNLLLSQTLQSFCKEATSCSAIFALATGQAIGLLAKTQSFKYFSFLCKTGSSKIPAYYASSVLGVIAEGISFPLATQLGKNEKLEIGNFGNNFHGILTLALCKAIGKKLPINNFVFQHAIQDCAMVSLDMTCEFLGIIEQKNSSGVERLLDAEITSIRIEASMKLLAMSCSGFSGMQAKRELGFEFEMGIKIKRNEKNPWFGDRRFSPEMVASNGLLIKMNTERKVSSRQFSIQAKDLRMLSEGSHPNGGKRDLKETTVSSETDEIFLDLLPKTSQTRWREVRAENKKLAAILMGTWNELCGNPDYLKSVYDRERLVDQYEIASKYYLRKTGRYSEKKICLLIDYGIEIFFRRISEAEYFHIEDRSMEEVVLRSENRDAKRTRIGIGKGKAHHKLQIGLRREQAIPKVKEIATLKDYENLKRDHPELARWVQVSLASWSGVLDGVKEKHPQKSQELTGHSQTAFDTFEVNARTCLRRLVPPVPVQTIYEEVLPLAFKFRHLHEEISAFTYGLKVTDYYSPIRMEIHSSPMHAHRRFLPPKIEGSLDEKVTVDSQKLPSHPDDLSLDVVDVKELPDWLQKRLSRQKRGADPRSALYILGTAIARSGKKLSELEDLAHTHFDDLLKFVEADRESRRAIDLDILVRVKEVFDQLSVSFDCARFCQDLFPYALEIFPTLAESSPVIIIDHEQWEKTFFFNLGKRLLAYRLDQQRAEQQITYEQLAEKISSCGIKIARNTVQRYEMNLVQVLEDRILRSIARLLNFSQTEQQMAYLASRPEFVQLVPVYIRTAEGALRILSVEEIKVFKKNRSRYLNSVPYRRELEAALLVKGIKTEREFADYLESRGIKRSTAKNFLILGDYISEKEIEDITRVLDLSYSKWQRYFDQSLDSYFLNTDPVGNVLYPTETDFEKLSKIPPCSSALLAEKYPEVNGWNELSLEQKWHLYLVQRVSHKFGNNTEGAKKTGIAIVRSYGQFRLSILNRSWTNETIAQFANSCELTPDERALLYMYFRQKSLMKKI